MFAIVMREKPGRPWELVSYHKGPRAKAQASARLTEEQERGVLRHPKAVVKVVTPEQWERGLGGTRRRARASSPRTEERPLSLDEMLAELEKESRNDRT